MALYTRAEQATAAMSGFASDEEKNVVRKERGESFSQVEPAPLIPSSSKNARGRLAFSAQSVQIVSWIAWQL